MPIERSTLITGITVVLFLALVSLPLLGGMNIICTSAEMTRAKLALIREILSHCQIQDPLPDHALECIRQYAVDEGISLSYGIPFTYDTYGELFVLAPTGTCKAEFPGPYSKGPNRIDECGRGDDIR